MEIPESGVPVLSQERLSGSPHSSGFDAKAIAGRLKEAFPEGRVLIVIREQRSMTLSNYFQFLRIGGAMALGDYISGKYDGRLPGFSPNHFKYDGLIEHYQELFGNESVLVLPFELFCSDPRAFVARVAKFSEAEVPEDLEYGDRLNKGLPRLVEYRTRALNYLAYRDSTNGYSPWASRAGFRIVRWLHRQLIRVVPDSTEAKFVEGLRAEIADFTGDCYAESNRRTEAMTGLDLRSLGYK